MSVTSGSKRCPYCASPGPFTRERIFPDWLCELRNPKVSLSARLGNRPMKTDLVIRDVCRKCNNGVLADLDGYAKTLLPAIIATGGHVIPLVIDGRRILRWVLEAAFNSARSEKRPVDEFKALIPFIVGAGTPPQRVDLLATLISSARATAAEREAGADTYLTVQGWDAVGLNRFFGANAALAPSFVLGPLLLQAIVWAPRVTRPRQREVIRSLRKRMQFQVLRMHSHRVELQPSALNARTWREKRDGSIQGR